MGTDTFWSEDRQFALFLKKQKTIPETKLQICLDEQKRRKPAQVQLSTILVENNVVTIDQVAELLTQWKGGQKVRVTADVILPPVPEEPPPPNYLKQNQEFLAALKTAGFLSEEQIKQALVEQEKEQNKGRFVQLSSIVLMKKWLSEEQLLQCLSSMMEAAKVHFVAEEVPPKPVKIKKVKPPKVAKVKKIAQVRPKKEPKPKPIKKKAVKKVAVKKKAIKKAPVVAKTWPTTPKATPKKKATAKKAPSVAQTPVAATNDSSSFLSIDFNTACSQAAQENKFVLIHFLASWCAPSKLYEATTWKDDEVIEWLENQAVAIKVDIDQETELTTKFQVRSVPMVLILSPNHSIIKRIEGYQTAENFLLEVRDLKLPQVISKEKAVVPSDLPTGELGDVSLAALSQLMDTKLEQFARQLAVQGVGGGGGASQGKTAAKSAKEGDEIEISEKKYKVISAEHFVENLQKGIAMEGVYVGPVSATETTFSKKISVKTSYIVECDFTSSTFEKVITFSGTSFEEKPVFAKAKFLKDANFKGCFMARGGDFKSIRCDKEFHFNGTFSKGYVTFQAGEFRGRSIFTRAQFETESNFLDARFKDYASFSDAKFGGRGTFEKMRFSKDVTFSNSTFGFTTMFKSTEFVGECKFLNVVFEGSIWFSHCKYRSNVSYKGSTFRAEGVFTGARFEKVAEFEGVAGDRFLSFNQVSPQENTAFIFSNTSVNKIAIRRETVENHVKYHLDKNWKKAQKEYGLLKNNFNDINEYEDEDWAYLWEKRCERYQVPISIRQPKKTLSKFINWLVLDITCGYGTKPINTFFAAAAIIFGFALIYFGFNQIQPHFNTGDSVATAGMNETERKIHDLTTSEYNTLQQCVFYSFKIFTAAEIPSVEPGAHPLHPIHIVILVESFLGIFMITILVIAFSRKVIR